MSAAAVLETGCVGTRSGGPGTLGRPGAWGQEAREAGAVAQMGLFPLAAHSPEECCPQPDMRVHSLARSTVLFQYRWAPVVGGEVRGPGALLAQTWRAQKASRSQGS